MINNYIWEVGDFVDDLEQFRQIVVKKRLKTEQTVSDFLFPKYVLPDPFLLTDMERAVKRIGRAIKDKERILIYGDYDADGVTSLALLYELFKFFEIEVEIYIPDRMTEGYGLKYSVLKEYIEEGIALVITVDCGIRDIEVVRKSVETGLDIIVTDHHELGTKIPEAYAVINPKRENSRYPEKELAGVGVAYTLARGLMKHLLVDEKKQESFLKWNLDLVAIGTVADMVPLLGENRILVKYGLIVLAKSQKKGLRELLIHSGIDGKKLTSWDIGYCLAPRLNASGRMDDANYSFNILVEEGQLEAEVLAKNLESKNQERKVLTERIWQEVEKKIDAADLPDCILQVEEGWSKGVLGLIASRAVKRFNRPAIIATYDGDKIVGSARSVLGINIVKLLDESADLLSQYGGHEKAAGLSMLRKNWLDFRQRINQSVQDLALDSELKQKLSIEAVVDNSLIGADLANFLEELHPYGIDNEEPVLMMEKCQVLNRRLIGKNTNHFKINFSFDNRKQLEGIAWNRSDLFDLINDGDNLDVAFTLRKNSWQGQENFLLNIIDLRKNL